MPDSPFPVSVSVESRGKAPAWPHSRGSGPCRWELATESKVRRGKALGVWPHRAGRRELVRLTLSSSLREWVKWGGEDGRGCGWVWWGWGGGLR